MTPIEEAVLNRSANWQHNTDEIFNMMRGVTEGIVTHLANDDELSQCDIVWRGITFEDDYVEITSTLIYPAGSHFIDANGDSIEVTEDSVDYFRRPLTMYFPLNMIIDNEATAITDYLAKMKQDAAPPVEITEATDEELLEKKYISILLQAKNPTGVLH